MRFQQIRQKSFHQIQSKSHRIYLISCQNLGFFVGIWIFLAGIWVFFSWFGFFEFWGRETEIDLPESISSGEDPQLTAEVVGLASVESDLVSFFDWVVSLDRFGQPIGFQVEHKCRLKETMAKCKGRKRKRKNEMQRQRVQL